MKDIAVGTSSNTFFRSIGATIGVAVFGAIYANSLTRSVTSSLAPIAKANPAAVPSPAQIAAMQQNPNLLFTGQVPPVVQHAVLNSYTHAFHVVFLTAVPLVLLGFLFALALRETPLRSGAAMETAREEAAGEAFA